MRQFHWVDKYSSNLQHHIINRSFVRVEQSIGLEAAPLLQRGKQPVRLEHPLDAEQTVRLHTTLLLGRQVKQAVGLEQGPLTSNVEQSIRLQRAPLPSEDAVRLQNHGPFADGEQAVGLQAAALVDERGEHAVGFDDAALAARDRAVDGAKQAVGLDEAALLERRCCIKVGNAGFFRYQI